MKQGKPLETIEHSRYKFRITLGMGIFSVALLIFVLYGNVESAERFDSKLSEEPQPSQFNTVQNSQPNSQRNERFGDAFTIMPHQIQPGVEQPILESFDGVPKPSE